MSYIIRKFKVKKNMSSRINNTTGNKAGDLLPRPNKTIIVFRVVVNLTLPKYTGEAKDTFQVFWKILYSNFMSVCSIVYSFFMPVCSIVRGALNDLMHYCKRPKAKCNRI